VKQHGTWARARLKTYCFQASPHPLRRPAQVRGMLCAAGQRVSGSGRHAHTTRQTCPSTCSRLLPLRAAAGAHCHCSCGCAPGRADTDGIATRSSNERKVCSSWSFRYCSAACVSFPAQLASTLRSSCAAIPGLFMPGSVRELTPGAAHQGLRALHTPQAPRAGATWRAWQLSWLPSCWCTQLPAQVILHVLQLDPHALKTA